MGQLQKVDISSEYIPLWARVGCTSRGTGCLKLSHGLLCDLGVVTTLLTLWKLTIFYS